MTHGPYGSALLWTGLTMITAMPLILPLTGIAIAGAWIMLIGLVVYWLGK